MQCQNITISYAKKRYRKKCKVYKKFIICLIKETQNALEFSLDEGCKLHTICI